MSKEQILKELNEIFKEVFFKSDLIIDFTTSPDDIEEWDSLAQITIITEVEKKYKIDFSINEVLKLQNVGNIVDMVYKRQK